MTDVSDIASVVRRLQNGDFDSFRGLPVLSAAALDEVLCPPADRTEVQLGWYPATKATYRTTDPAGPVVAYVRGGGVVMIEAGRPRPAGDMLKALGEPSSILPNELLMPGAYVHEYVYGSRGLILSVAEPFEAGQPWQIIRSRAIVPLQAGRALGPELYRAAEDADVW
ncbi:MAG: hypothetical protein ACR2KK_05230 [Acidimicrobiales bacterium]